MDQYSTNYYQSQMKAIATALIGALVLAKVILPILAYDVSTDSQSRSGFAPDAGKIANDSGFGKDHVESSPDAQPEVLVAGQFNEWTLGGGMLYWAHRCAEGPDAAEPSPNVPLSHYYLRRMPAGGGTTRTLASPDPEDCRTFLNMAADDSGVYYFDEVDGQIEKVPIEVPDGPPLVLASGVGDVSTQLTLDGPYIYWGTSSSDIRRVDIGGGSPTTIVNTTSKPRDLVVYGAFVYWVDSDGLWSASTQCSSLPCTRNLISSHGGTSLVMDTGAVAQGYPSMYWVDNGSPHHIRRLACAPLGGCTAPTLYDAPWSIGQLITIDLDPLEPGASHLSWTESVDFSSGRVLRLPIEGGTAQVVAATSGYIDPRLALDSTGLYFADLELNNNTIERLPAGAGPLKWDLAFDGWEVTQGIQNLNNEVPLVAGKITYARVYGRRVDGPRAIAVEAHLYGWREGEPLPGSPLLPVDGAQSLQPGSGPFARMDPDRDWLFQLPDSWTEPGVTTLQAVVDPREVYPDTDRTNNESISSDFAFVFKGPVCPVFVPVRTHWPTPSTDNPHFGAMIDLLERLWPVSEVLPSSRERGIAETQGCFYHPYIDKPFTGCAYQIDDRDQVFRALLQLGLLSLFSDIPAGCVPTGCYPSYWHVHQVGMIHHDATLGDNWLGFANLMFPVSLVKFPDPASPRHPEDSNWPKPGVVLAHELAHNRGRLHVDCPSGRGGVDPDYPYDRPDSCSIHDRELGLDAPETSYGFDINNLEPIRPDAVADLMSSISRRWPSDYTWKAIFDRTCPGGFCSPDLSGYCWAGGLATEAGARLSNAQAVAIASGYLIPSLKQGSLNYAWKLPTGSTGAGILQKWQDLVAPQVGAESGGKTDSAQPNCHLRLVAGDGLVLDDRIIQLEEASEASENVPPGNNFVLTFPAPDAEVARVQLMVDDSIVDELVPGPGAPIVQVSQPTGGEALDDGMTVIWQASDPDSDDALLFTVQYSPDLGQTWYALATDFSGSYGSPTVTLTLDSLNGISGSKDSTALVRVIASDGYHTTLANSAPFTVLDRSPQPYIASPAPGQTFLAGQAILLRGNASDMEDGSLPRQALEWALDGQAVGTDRARVIKGLAPGAYDVALTARDSSGQEATVSASMNVSPLEIPLGDRTPTMDGHCDEQAYEEGRTLQLAPYPDSAQASVHLLRSDEYLWACFSGLERADTFISFVGLHLDVDHSRDELPKNDDYGFFVGEDGTPIAVAGNGLGGWADSSIDPLATRISASETIWSAEMRLDSSVLGGWQHTIGLELGQHDVHAAGDGYGWPYAADPYRPITWASTVLGQWPQIDDLDPVEAASGGEGFGLVVDGSGFATGATVLWDGGARATTVVSSTRVTAEIEEGDLDLSGQVAVTVINPGLEGAPSNPRIFSINNPRPKITDLNPSSVPSQSPGFTLTIWGQDFVDGATVLWNGIEKPTAFVRNDQLQAEIGAEEISMARSLGLSVFNPGPGGGGSNVVRFIVEPTHRLFMPAVLK